MDVQPTKSPTTPDPRGHFGFTEWPFTSEIQVGKMWRHPGLDELVDDLEETVSARFSAAVIAPSGSGKTALLRRLVERLPETRYRVADVKADEDLAVEIRALRDALDRHAERIRDAMTEVLDRQARATNSARDDVDVLLGRKEG